MADVIFALIIEACCLLVGYAAGVEGGKTDFCKQHGGTYIQEKCVVEMKELEIKK